MRLDVRVLGAEEQLGAVAGEVLDLVDDLAAAVVALARDTLGVLVVEPRAERLEHRHRGEILRGDELEGFLLALQFGIEQCGKLRVGGAHRRLLSEPGVCEGALASIDRCAAHWCLCPSVLVDVMPPRSERITVAGIGPSRTTRGVVVVQSMIVEGSPPQRPPSTMPSISPFSAAATSAAVPAGCSP